ncbi:MAG: hypothetical protein LQ350_001325 [Teloschistes chrysophthalmus]|nr:MAG: hypothetical protein LQ350_001325 [Niorma chrysophthalma]
MFGPRVIRHSVLGKVSAYLKQPGHPFLKLYGSCQTFYQKTSTTLLHSGHNSRSKDLDRRNNICSYLIASSAGTMNRLIATFEVQRPGKSPARIVFDYDHGLEVLGTLIRAEMHFKPASSTTSPNPIRQQITALSDGFSIKIDPVDSRPDMNLMDVMEKIIEVSERIGAIRCGNREGHDELDVFRTFLQKVCEYCVAKDGPDTVRLLNA